MTGPLRGFQRPNHNDLSPMPGRSDFIPLEPDTLLELYWDRGLTIPEVAEELGVTLRTVHRRMIEAGVLGGIWGRAVLMGRNSDARRRSGAAFPTPNP
jgi:hypothetical protein